MARSKKNGNNRGNSYWQNSNGTQPMDVDTQRSNPASQGGYLPTCHACKQVGHKKPDCPNRQNLQNHQSQGHNQVPNTQANNGGQQGNSGRPQCDICKKIGHWAVDCWQNPSNPKSRIKSNNNRTGNDNFGSIQNAHIQQQALPTNVYVLNQGVPEYFGSEPYCLVCNANDHFQRDCQKRKNNDLHNTTLRCWKCECPGHIANDCKNPQQMKCSTCRMKGHKTEECKNRLYATAFGTSLQQITRPEERFGYRDSDIFELGRRQFAQVIHEQQQEDNSNDIEMEDGTSDVVEPRRIAFPSQTQPVQQISNSNSQAGVTRPAQTFRPNRTVQTSTRIFSTGPNYRVSKLPQDTAKTVNHTIASPHFLQALQRYSEECVSAQDRAIRNKIDMSAKLYRKQNYNNTIRRLSPAIVENRVLTENTNFLLGCHIAQGSNFWRDPKVMEALVYQQKPQCHCCGQDGIILDGHMLPIEIASPADILDIKDYEDWGPFVMFGCKCCNEGYSWVPSSVLPILGRYRELPLQ